MEEELYGSKKTAAELMESLKAAEDEHQVTLDAHTALEQNHKEL